MASNPFRDIRQWAAPRPTYDRVPTDDGVEEELEERKEATADERLLRSSSSSSGGGGVADPETSQHENDGYSFGRETRRVGSKPATGLVGTAFEVRTLMIRLTYLCWLVITSPLRRRGGRGIGAESGGDIVGGGSSSWPAVYEQLGGFKILVPSFLQPADPGPARKLHPTAWLDGLRGMAAFFVVCTHSSVLCFSWHIHNGWGISENEKWLIQLPIVRLVIAGPPQVAIFFIVSGYALSYKPLKLSRMGRYGDAYDAIGSSAFRRWPRLFFMPVVITFVCALMTWLDIYDTAGWSGTAIPSYRPPRPGTFWGQMAHWFSSVVALTDPFSKNLKRGKSFVYDPFLWTLPVEFDCSLMLFLCQACFNRIRPNVRVLLMFFLAVFTMKYIYWQYFLFIIGMIVCDLQFAFNGTGGNGNGNGSNSGSTAPLPTTTTTLTGTGIAATVSRIRRFATRYHTLIGVFFFILSLHILSTPETARGAVGTPGFQTMISWVPQLHYKSHNIDFFWVPIGAALLVFTVDRTPRLQGLFTHWFPQYLGKISYSMYVLHGPTLFSAGHWFVRHTTAWTGKDTQVRYGLGVFLAAIPLWVSLIFMADLVTRTLDKWSLSLGRKLYESLSSKRPNPEPVLPRTS